MSVPLLSPRERLTGAHRCYVERGGGRTQADTAYLVYLVVLMLAMVVIPLLIGSARVLSKPEILAALQSPVSEQVVLAASGTLLAAASALGVHRGPANLPPVLVGALAGTDLPRSRTLLRPFAVAAVGLTLLVTTSGGLLMAAVLGSGDLDLAGAAAFTGASACLGLIAATAWLAGQRVGSRHGWLLTAFLLAAMLVTLAIPGLANVTPWGWVAQTWPPTAEGEPWALLPLTLVALVCAERTMRLLDRLRGPALLEQARTWQVVTVAAFTGDFSAALATYRVRPRLGRSWPALWGVPVVVQYAVRDLVGAARTPVRALTGVAFLTLGGFLTALGLAEPSVPAWVLAGLGAVATFTALGTLTDGFRHTAEARWAPTLFGYSTARLFLLHATLPLAGALICSLGGAALARAVGWSSAEMLGAAVLGLLVVAVRAYDSTKGPLPLTLLTPAPSPVGDMSGLMVMVWQADALILAIALGAGLTLITAAGGALVTAGAAVVAAAVLIALTYGRLNRT